MSWKRGLAGAFVLAVAAAFLYVPLFAWSPVHPGYIRLSFKRADVLYPADRPRTRPTPTWTSTLLWKRVFTI